MKAYVGIDLSFAKNKRLPICITIRRNSKLIPLPLKTNSNQRNYPCLPKGYGNLKSIDTDIVSTFCKDVLDYLTEVALIEKLDIIRIAIDAPARFKDDGEKRRSCEIALDKIGLSCFTTPSKKEFDGIIRKVNSHVENGGSESTLPHANQLWMLVGFRLFETLTPHFECIEVYPQAIAHTMGVAKIHKSKKAGFEGQLNAAAKHTGWSPKSLRRYLTDACFGSAHDKLDAYLSSWVASLEHFERIGYPRGSDDAIWAPDLDKKKKMFKRQGDNENANYLSIEELKLLGEVTECFSSHIGSPSHDTISKFSDDLRRKYYWEKKQASKTLKQTKHKNKSALLTKAEIRNELIKLKKKAQQFYEVLDGIHISTLHEIKKWAVSSNFYPSTPDRLSPDELQVVTAMAGMKEAEVWKHAASITIARIGESRSKRRKNYAQIGLIEAIADVYTSATGRKPSVPWNDYDKHYYGDFLDLVEDIFNILSEPYQSKDALGQSIRRALNI